MSIIYEQIDVTAAAGLENLEVAFTSSSKQKYKLLGITINNVASTVDLLVQDERETIADIPVDVKGIIEKWIDFDRDIEVGHQLSVGLRNGTGGSITLAICLKCDIS